jgi:outer membrane protein assembly factor BamB
LNACGGSVDAGGPPQDAGATCAERFGDRGDQTITAVSVDGTGAITVAGKFEGNVDFGGGPLSALNALGDSFSTPAVFLARYDASCKHLWSKRFDDDSDIALDRDGGGLVRTGANITYFDASGTATWTSSVAVSPPLFAADREGGVAEASPPVMVEQGGGGGAQTWPGAVTRLDAKGKQVWLQTLPTTIAPSLVSIDRAGNVYVFDANGHAVYKLDASTGASLWCVGVDNLFAMKVDSQDNVLVAQAAGSNVDVIELGASGCAVRQEKLVLPAGMPLPGSIASPMANGSVAISPWGDVHLTTVGEHINVASFAADGSVLGSGVYGRTGQHPAPVIAAGPTGEVVVAGGFSRDDIALGDGTLTNAFTWSTDAFVIRNPPYAALGSDPSVPVVSTHTLSTIRAASTYALAAGNGSVYWAEPGASVPQFDVYRCSNAGGGVGEPKKLGTLPGGYPWLATTPTGVLAVGPRSPTTTTLHCDGDVCTTDSISQVPSAFGAGTGTFAFEWYNPAIGGDDLSSCSVSGCGAAPTLVSTKQDPTFTQSHGLFLTPGAIDLGWPMALSCPVTGCGTTPPIGTEWVTRVPTFNMATDAANVYLHADVRIELCPFSGCTAGREILAGGLGNVSYAFSPANTPRIATDGTSIYFFDAAEFARWVPGSGVRLLRCPVGGCPASGPEILWTSPAWPGPGGIRPLALAVDDTSVYFTALQADGSFALVQMAK